MRSTPKTVFIALALAVGVASGAAAQTEPFADLDNDGQYGAGDVLIGALVNNDGQFSTAKAEGKYVPPASGKVGIVVPAKFVGKKRALVLKASGDITVHGQISAPGNGGVIVLLSTDGSVNVDPGVRLQTDSIIQLIAMHDVSVGDNAELRSKSNDFSMVSVASQAGDVAVGEMVTMGAAGLVEVTTADESGGTVTVGKGARLASGSGACRVTAGDDVVVAGVKMAARDVLIGSHASTSTGRSTKGPGYVSMRNSQIRSPHGQVHVFAHGPGGTIDASKASLQAATPSDVVLEADVVVR